MFGGFGPLWHKPMRMNKKRWALLLLFVLLLVGYFKLFYKTWSNEAVLKSADCIIALDVKRVTNTLIWNFISTPSQWKAGNVFRSEKEELNWSDMVILPDYIFVFHLAGQPVKAWYTLLEIKDTADFNKGLALYHFEKRNNNEYFSTQTGIEFIKKGNWLLLANLAVDDKKYLRQAAEEYFTKKQYATAALLKKNIDADSHVSVLLTENGFLQQDHIITGNFDKNSIRIEAKATAYTNISLPDKKFTYSDSSLCTLAFTQPQPGIQALLGDSARAAISKALNFSIDSLLRPTNTQYLLDLQDIKARTDSAISYSYDDNFNPVENVIVNTVAEPAFNFTVAGAATERVYDYWVRNGSVEKTAAGDWFTPMPFVKAYCRKKNEQELTITASNYTATAATSHMEAILFFKLLLHRIPASLQQYLPGDTMTAIKNLDCLELLVKNENGLLYVALTLYKKKNDLPLFEWEK